MELITKRPILRKAFATGLFVCGVVALILPILPGWLFLGAGLYLMSIDSPIMQEHIARYRLKSQMVDKILRFSYDRFHKPLPLPPKI